MPSYGFSVAHVSSLTTYGHHSVGLSIAFFLGSAMDSQAVQFEACVSAAKYELLHCSVCHDATITASLWPKTENVLTFSNILQFYFNVYSYQYLSVNGSVFSAMHVCVSLCSPSLILCECNTLFSCL